MQCLPLLYERVCVCVCARVRVRTHSQAHVTFSLPT